MSEENQIEFEILDIDGLLSPISKDNPVGENLRYEDVYDKIKDARISDDPNLPQGVWETELKVANWNEVRTLCNDALLNRSKDLQVVAWMIEALLHQEGFIGLLEGIEFLHLISKKYWQDIYPQIDGDDNEFRLSPFVWLNEKVSGELKQIPLTQSDQSDNYCFFDWEKILRNERDQNVQSLSCDDSGKKLSKQFFYNSVQETGLEYYRDLIKSLLILKEKMQSIEKFLDTQMGDESPGIGRFIKSLDEIYNHIDFLTKSFESSDSEVDGESAVSLNSLGFMSERGSLKGRDEAYTVLMEVANYLIDIDPHSPAPHLVIRAVKWGRMELNELLAELLKDGQNINQIYSLLGMEGKK